MIFLLPMADSVSRTSFTFRRPELILFTAQIFLIVIVSFASIINLSLGYGNQNLWTVLLTSGMGIMMPNPKLKVDRDNKGMFGSVNRKNQSRDGSGVLHDVVI